MKLNNRPSNQELGYFANLIGASSEIFEKPLNRSDAEWIRRLDYHGITLLALQEDKLPDGVVKLLQGRKAMMVANEQLKRAALTELFGAFANAGLERNILFKGSALAYTVYEQPWLRPRSDSDILIELAEHPAFAEVLFALGYQKLFAIEGRHISYQHTYSKQLAGQSVMNIDIHWRINNRQALAKSYGVDELIESGSVVNAICSHAKVPNPVDSLLIASLHRLGHHHNEERLTWLHDIHLLANTLEVQQWSLLCNKAEQKNLAGITLDALKFTQRLFETSIPKSTMDNLRSAATQKENSQVFLNRQLPEWRYFLADVKALDGWRNKANLLWENLFPTPDYVRQQMATKSATYAYIKRALRGVSRFIR